MNGLAWLKLARVSNLPTAWTNVLAAWYVSGGSLWPLPLELGLLLVGATGFYCAGMILNDAADVTWDRAHRPERPIPQGLVSLIGAWTVGLTLLISGAVLFLWAGAALGWTLALGAVILAYDLYHKPWAGAVVVMGACRTFLYLAAGSAQEPSVWSNSALWMPAVALGIYIVGLTLTARSESGATPSCSHHLKIMATGYMLLVPIIPLLGVCLFVHFGVSGGSLPGGALLILPYLLFISTVTTLMSRGGKSVGDGVGWLLAGIAAVDALAVAASSWPLALCFMAMVPLLRVWQRWVAAT